MDRKFSEAPQPPPPQAVAFITRSVGLEVEGAAGFSSWPAGVPESTFHFSSLLV